MPQVNFDAIDEMVAAADRDCALFGDNFDPDSDLPDFLREALLDEEDETTLDLQEEVPLITSTPDTSILAVLTRNPIDRRTITEDALNPELIAVMLAMMPRRRKK